MNKQKQLGAGFIQEACDTARVTRGVYYNAIRNQKEGKPLSKDQIEVLSVLEDLKSDAREKLKRIE